jgi:hypothetical protein
MGVTLLALIPTLVLARIERRTRAADTTDIPVAIPADEPLLEAA